MKTTLFLPLKKEWYNLIDDGIKLEEYREVKPYWSKRISREPSNVVFTYGYTRKRMSFHIESISIGYGRTDWGAPKYEVYIIKLGKRIY